MANSGNIQICLSGYSQQEKVVLQNVLSFLNISFNKHLSKETTHLVCNKVGTDKYMIAKYQLKIPILVDRWILDSKSALQDMDGYELGIFGGLVISVTGSVFGSKYEFAVKLQTVIIVKKEWFDECLRKKAYLDPALYTFDQPYVSNNNTISSNISNLFEMQNVYISLDFPVDKSQQFKSLIRKNGGAVMKEFDQFVTYYLVETDLSERDIQVLQSLKHNVSVITSKWITDSIAAQKVLPYPSLQNYEPRVASSQEGSSNTKAKIRPTRKMNVNEIYPRELINHVEMEDSSSNLNAINEKVGLFAGLSFSWVALNQDKTDRLRNALKSEGGNIYSDPSKLIKAPGSKSDKYLVVHSSCEKNVYMGWISELKIASHCWVEKCIDDRKIYPLTHSVVFKPLSSYSNIPISEFSKFVIGITGYDGIERVHIGKLCNALGATFVQNFSKKNTHLICTKSDGEQSGKLEKAMEWGIVCVRRRWLEECILQGKYLPPTTYRYTLPTEQSNKPFRFDTKAIYESLPEPNSPGLEKTFSTNLKSTTDSVVEKVGLKSDDRDLSDVLKGISICYSSRLIRLEEKIVSVANRLGAQLLSNYSDRCTHYLHMSNKTNETFKDFKTALSKKKFIISPFWLFKCEELGERVDEKDFPHTYMSTTSTLKFELSQVNRPEGSSQVQIKRKVNEEVHDSSQVNAIAEEIGQLISTSKTNMKEIPALSLRPKYNQKKSSISSTSKDTTNYTEAASSTDNLTQLTKPNSRDEVDVGYDDDEETAGRMHLEQIFGNEDERRAALEKLGTNKREGDSNAAEGAKKRKKAKPVFIFKRLGGKFMDTTNWNPDCTHLILNTPSKTEKCLAAVASGAWMVTPQYIYESELAKKFLNEEEWEWRADNGNTEFNVAKLWRLYLRRPGNTMTGVFHAWKVYMAMENMDKAEPMKRVLEAGGAEVRISGEPAFPIPADEEYTHCVADGKYIEAASRLEQEGFTVTTIQTIAQILVKGPVPNYTEE